MSESRSKRKTYWDGVFRASLKWGLERFGNSLIMTDEYSLNELPNRIDMLIIRKNGTHDALDDSIAGFFKGYNVIEFKSPSDKLGVKDWWRGVAYAALLIKYGFKNPESGKIEEVAEDDVTLTFIKERRPALLVKHLADIGMEGSEPYAGVYRFLRKGDIPVQIAAYGEMDDSRHALLRSLRREALDRDIKSAVVERLSEVSLASPESEKVNAELIMRFMRRHHAELTEQEGDHMSLEALVFEMAADKINMARAEGRVEGEARGEARGIIQGIINLGRRIGMSARDMADQLVALVPCTPAEAERMLAEYQ